MGIGTECGFAFTIECWSMTSGTNYQRRAGRGVIVSTEDYSAWPCPGYAIRVTESPDYATGEIVHVSPLSVRP